MSAATSAQLRAVEELLSELFDADEFRHFIRRLDGGEKLEAALVGKVATTDLLLSEAVLALSRRGEIDVGFFEALVEERPKKAARIWDVAAVWGVALPSPTTSMTPRPAANPVQLVPETSALPGSAADRLKLLELDDQLKELQRRARLVRLEAVKSPFADPDHPWVYRTAYPVGTMSSLALRVGESAMVDAEFAAGLLEDHSEQLRVIDPDPLPVPPRNPRKPDRPLRRPPPSAEEIATVEQAKQRYEFVLGMTAAQLRSALADPPRRPEQPVQPSHAGGAPQLSQQAVSMSPTPSAYPAAGLQVVHNHGPVGQQFNIQGGTHVFNLGKGNG